MHSSIPLKPPVLKIVSSNQRKSKYAAEILKPLGLNVVSTPLKLQELQSDDLSAIARHKAAQAFELLGPHVVVEDGGLFIEALNGFPGPYTAYVARTLGAIGLCNLLAGVPDRRAIFRSVLIYVDGDGSEHQFIDDTNCLEIADRPSEQSCGDGWSDLWSALIPLGESRPYTELHPNRIAEWLMGRQRRSTFMQLGLFFEREQCR